MRKCTALKGSFLATAKLYLTICNADIMKDWIINTCTKVYINSRCKIIILHTKKQQSLNFKDSKTPTWMTVPMPKWHQVVIHPDCT